MATLLCETRVQAPAERCFDLARSVDLHVDSSPEIDARAVGGRRAGLSVEGDETVWSARFFGLRFRMMTRIERFDPPAGFNDRMTSGLLRRFDHAYGFRALPDGGCTMSDTLTVEAPFGPLGRLVEWLYLARRMGRLAQLRLERIRRVAEGEDWRHYVPASGGTDHAPLPPNP